MSKNHFPTVQHKWLQFTFLSGNLIEVMWFMICSNRIHSYGLLIFPMQYFKICFRRNGFFSWLLIMLATFHNLRHKWHNFFIITVNPQWLKIMMPLIKNKWSSLLWYLFSGGFLSYFILVCNYLDPTETVIDLLLYIVEYNCW